jgi:hypothetical protein
MLLALAKGDSGLFQPQHHFVRLNKAGALVNGPNKLRRMQRDRDDAQPSALAKRSAAVHRHNRGHDVPAPCRSSAEPSASLARMPIGILTLEVRVA